MNLNEAGLAALAELLRARHSIDDEIATLIDQTATSGNIGEVVAASIFDIELAVSGVNPGYDGHFRSGWLAGSTVNVKAYAERTGILDISPHPCDWYLVLMGPPRASMEKGRSLPFRIAGMYLFDIQAVKAVLTAAGLRIGVASSVRKVYWEAAEIYPNPAPEAVLIPDEIQRRLLGMSAPGMHHV